MHSLVVDCADKQLSDKCIIFIFLFLDDEEHPSETDTQSRNLDHQPGAAGNEQSVQVNASDEENRCSYIKRHKRPITKNLREIKLKDLMKFTTLKVGDFLCAPCYYTREPEPATTESVTTTENNVSGKLVHVLPSQ